MRKNNQKRKMYLIVAFFSLAKLAFAFDTGLELSNAFGWKDISEPDWYTDHKATAWLSFPLDAANTASFSMEGSFYAAKPANRTDYTYYGDLDLLRLTLHTVSSEKLKIDIDVGRIPVADSTGFVINQTLDGADFHGSLKFGNIDMFLGYTGLLNVRKGGSLMTTDDYEDYDTNKPFALGPKRAVGKLTIQFPQSIGTADLILEASGQYDVRRYIDSSYEQTVDTAYGTVGLSGPIVNVLYYTLSGTYQTGIMTKSGKKYSDNSVLASIRFDCFPVERDQFFAQFVFSPGSNDFFSEYLPITVLQAGTLYTEGYGNRMKASIGWNFSPTNFINLDLTGKAFAYTKLPTDITDRYIGSEVSGGATYKISSDLRFRLDSALFAPYNDDLRYQIFLKAILSL
jgi:hypothetical protein